MRVLVPALAALMLTAAGASAQSINIGPGGVEVDPRSPRERAVDREIRREERRRDRWEDRRDFRAERRGDCRTEVVIRDTPRGEVRTTRRVCD